MPFQPRVVMLVPAPNYTENWQPALARKVAALAEPLLGVSLPVVNVPGARPELIDFTQPQPAAPAVPAAPGAL